MPDMTKACILPTNSARQADDAKLVARRQSLELAMPRRSGYSQLRRRVLTAPFIEKRGDDGGARLARHDFSVAS